MVELQLTNEAYSIMQTPNHGGTSYPHKHKSDFATADAKRKISNGSDSLAPLAWISIAIPYKN